MVRDLPTGTVTLLFTDIEGSTALLRRLGPAYGDVLATHHRVLREVWAAHAGTEVDTEGDAFFVAFGRPGDGLGAAAAAQAALAGTPALASVGMRVRMGLHTGTPEVRDGTYWGEDVHYAARLASAAHGGQVLVSSATAAIAGDDGLLALGDHALKDFTVPRPVWQLGDAPSPPIRSLPRSRTNLEPIAGDFVGRDADLAAVGAGLSGSARLLTLTGPGGSGKTQLALRVAHDQLDHRRDGVFLVPLAAVRDPAGVPEAVVAALGLVERPGVALDQLVAEHLADKDLLLVLDNFEQLLAGAASVAALVRQAPALRVLVTSQAPLRVAGEHVHAVAPLARDAAERLFRERAGAALTASEDAAVAELCERLEGLPLALELAAGRVATVGVAGLLERLDAGVGVLRTRARDVEERHRTLTAALAWTTELLPASARDLLDVVAAMPGGIDRELLEAATGADPDDLLDDLEDLIGFSLVHREERRYRCAQAVRAHVREARGDRARAVNRDLLAALAATAEAWQRQALDRLAEANAWFLAEAENLDAALRWGAEHERVLHARLTGATVASALEFGRGQFFADHLRMALEAATGDEPWAIGVRASAAGALVLDGGVPAAVDAMLTAADDFERIGEDDRAVSVRGVAAYFLSGHDLPRAHDVLDAAQRGADSAADPSLRLFVRSLHAQLAIIEGDVDRAEALARAVLDVAPPGSYFLILGHVWADAALLRGDAAQTAPRYADALRFAWAVMGPEQSATELDGVSMGLVLAGAHEPALELMGAAEALRQAIALRDIQPWWQALLDRHADRASAALGPDAARAARARGSALDAPTAVARALRAADAVASGGAATLPPS